MAMHEHIAVVVPTFNEGQRIERTIRAIHAYLSSSRESYEIIIADDGSSDATGRIVTRLMQEPMPIRLLLGKTNRGKGNAVRRGVAASTADLILVTDADLATPIEEVEKLLERVRAGADIAIGSRGLGSSHISVHQPVYRELLGKSFNLLVQAAILPGIWDTQCGFKLFRGPIARGLFPHSTIDRFAFDVEVLGLAARAGFRIAEVPVRWSHISHSRVRLGRDGARMLWDMIKVAYKLRTGGYALSDLVPVRAETEPSVAPSKPTAT